MKFSVLLPTRNRLDLLTRAVETVIRQDYDDWEIIVSDNHSEEDIAGYIESIDEPRIKYFRTEMFLPVTDNWNNAIDRCDGDYIIMLGDDDCLMQGYFSYLDELIREFDSPDFVYTNAFLYAYPGVLDSAPEGFLRTYSRRRIYQSSNAPFLLALETARAFAKDALNFRVTFDYNMQFSLISRKLVQQMANHGPFFQSPYPDYYASNAMMLEAERILVVPTPLVTVGISPKSFGYFFYNDAEEDGNEFLNNLPDRDVANRLRDQILPGTMMNTSWLFSMEALASNYARRLGLDVNYDRYRLIQMLSVYTAVAEGNTGAERRYLDMKPHLRIREWIRFGLLFSALNTLIPDSLRRYRLRLFKALNSFWGSHPEHDMPYVNGNFDTILDVFEQVDPRQLRETMGER